MNIERIKFSLKDPDKKNFKNAIKALACPPLKGGA